MQLVSPTLQVRDTADGPRLFVWDSDVEISYPATAQIQAMWCAWIHHRYTGTDEEFYESMYDLAEPALQAQRVVRLLP